MKYPGTDLQTTNLDWLILEVKRLAHANGIEFNDENVHLGADNVQEAIEQLAEYVRDNIFVTPELYGAKGDGVTDDSEAIKAAVIAAGNQRKDLYFSNKNYRMTETLVIDNPSFNVIMSGYIVNNEDVVAIRILNGYKRRFILKVTSSNVAPYTNAGVLIENCTSCDIDIPNVDGFGTSLELLGRNDSCSYNRINLGYLNNGYIGVHLTTSGVGYVSENTFNKGRVHVDSNRLYYRTNTAIKIESASRICDHNIFNDTCIEGSGTGIYLDNAERSIFSQIRNESVTQNINIVKGFWNTIEFTHMEDVADDVLTVTPWNAFVTPYDANQALVYDSGFMPAKCFSNTSGIMLAPELFHLNNNALVSLIANGTKTLTHLVCTDHCPIGVVVDTKTYKRFSFTTPDDGRMCILCYDSNDQLLPDTDAVIGAQKMTVNNNSVWSSYGDREYHTVILPATCDHAFIGVWFRWDKPIRSFKIFSDINEQTLKSGIPSIIKYHSAAMASAPTCAGYDGEFVPCSSGSVIGWKFYNNTWNAVS